MAGQLKVNGVTLATEDSSVITLENPQIKDSSNNLILDQSGSRPLLKNVDIKDSSDNLILDQSGSKAVLNNVEVVNDSAMMFRNKIINGNFDFWQRGPYQTSSGYGSADRWYNEHVGSSKTVTQQAFTVGQTEVPGNPKYYLRHVTTSASGAGNAVVPNQRIEDVRTLAGKTATLSFWAKADGNKDIVTEFVQYFGSGGSPSPSSFVFGIGPTTHSLTTSWQKFTATVSIPSISGKTIGTDENSWLGLYFWFDAGSDFNSRTNSLGQQSGTFDIAQVQLEEGNVATPFEQRPYAIEYPLVGRYFQFFTTHQISVGMPNLLMENQASSTGLLGILYFDVPMRVLPAFELKGYGVYSGNVNRIGSIYALSVNTGMAPISVGSFNIRSVTDESMWEQSGTSLLPRTGKRPEGIPAAWFNATLSTSSYQSTWRLSGEYGGNTGILLDAEL